MILPIAFARPSEHKSAAPQGLILDHSDYERRWNLMEQESNDQGYRGETSGQNVVGVNDLDGQMCEISISHDDDFAAAVAMVPRMLEALPE